MGFFSSAAFVITAPLMAIVIIIVVAIIASKSSFTKTSRVINTTNKVTRLVSPVSQLNQITKSRFSTPEFINGRSDNQSDAAMANSLHRSESAKSTTKRSMSNSRNDRRSQFSNGTNVYNETVIPE